MKKIHEISQISVKYKHFSLFNWTKHWLNLSLSVFTQFHLLNVSVYKPKTESKTSTFSVGSVLGQQRFVMFNILQVLLQENGNKIILAVYVFGNKKQNII